MFTSRFNGGLVLSQYIKDFNRLLCGRWRGVVLRCWIYFDKLKTGSGGEVLACNLHIVTCKPAANCQQC